MKLAKQILTEKRNDTVVNGWVNSLIGDLSSQVLTMKKTLLEKENNLERLDTTPKEVYDEVLDSMERLVSKRVKVWKKLLK